MADTVLPPPDPNKPADPTFTPAPVPSTASSTPAPVSATPSDSGLAAPGTQPTSPSVAPGANGLSTPNPTVAGNSAATQGKETLSSLAQPAPLPLTPAQQAAKAAAAGAGASAAVSSAAAGTAGQNQQKTQAGVQAASADKGAAAGTRAGAAKTGLAATLDTLTPVNDTIKKMLDGNDPIAKIQFNQILTTAGPRNQALMAGLGMKLKQANLDGQGAGNALLAMTARDNEFGTEQLLANVDADSAKRLYDMNVHGFDKAIEIQTALASQVRADLSNAVSSGQWAAAKDLWGQVYPGVPFDEAAAKAASPTATANFNSRMKLVDQFVSQGDSTNAKAVMDKLAEDMPEMFGFPNDPAAAKAALSSIDFTTEAWQNNLKATNDATAAARTAALQGDPTALSTSIDQLFAKMTPAAVEAVATSAVKSRSLDEINQILKVAGMAPVASTDEAAMLDKTKFAKAVKSFDIMKDAHKTATDQMLDIFAKSDPAIAVDPNARIAAKAWLDAHAYALANSADGTSVSLDPSKLNPGELPPWDPASPQAYMYNGWPHATFNADGTVANVTIEDPIPYGDDYKPGDLTTTKGQEDNRLDQAYQKYKFSTPSSSLMTMKQWYFASAAGTKEPSASSLPSSLQPDNSTPDPTTFKPTSKTDPTTGSTSTTSLDPLTGKVVTTNTPAPNIEKEFQSNIGAGRTGINAYLSDHPNGAYVAVSQDGKTVAQITGKMVDVGSKYGRVVELKSQDGTSVYFDPGHDQYIAMRKIPGMSGLFPVGFDTFGQALSAAKGVK
jgi:hypothetical protein